MGLFFYANLTPVRSQQGIVMETKKVLEVVKRYKVFFDADGVENIKNPHNELFIASYQILTHCHSMLRGIVEFISSDDKEKRDRALIRLGFVQGCLAATRQFTVEDLKNHNKPDPNSNSVLGLEPLTPEDSKDWEY